MFISSFTRSLLLILALAAAGVARADTTVYKWVDKNGQVHYGPQPQSPAAQAITLHDAPATGEAPPAASTTPPLLPVSPNDPQACKAAKTQLDKYLVADTLYAVDAKGNRKPLTSEQRRRVIQQAQNQVSAACPPP